MTSSRYLLIRMMSEAAVLGLVIGLLALWVVPIGDTFFAGISIPTAEGAPCCVVTSLQTNTYLFYSISEKLLPLLRSFTSSGVFLLLCIGIAVGIQTLSYRLFNTYRRVSSAVAIACIVFGTILFEGVSLFSLVSCASLIVAVHSLHLLIYKQKITAPFFALLVLAVGIPIIFIPVTLIAMIVLFFSVSHRVAPRPLAVALVVGCALVALHYSTIPDSLEMPPYSRFVPGFGTNIGADPLIGLTVERPFIDRTWVSHRIVPFFLFGAVVLWISSFASQAGRFTGGLAAFVLPLFLQSSFVSKDVWVISPLAAITRIIPYAIFFPAEQLYAIGFLVFFTVHCCRFTYAKGNLLFLLFPLYLSVGAPTSYFFGTIASPTTPRAPAIPPFLLNAPSLYVIKEKLPVAQHPFHRVRLYAKDISSISSSHNKGQLSNIIRHRPKFRWSTKPHTQRGTEWIEFSLNTPKIISGISISVPHYSSDYPRGVTVLAGSFKHGICTANQLLYEEPWWRGPVQKFPNGYLGLGSESDVDLFFPQQRSVGCLKILQTGHDPIFEWSIEHIDLLVND